MERYYEKALRIVRELGAKSSINTDNYVCNVAATLPFRIGAAELSVEIAVFDSKTCRVDIDIYLPKDGVLADTFMEHCAAKEKTPKNHHGEYCSGPVYRDWLEENHGKQTFALSPWHNTSFYIRSERYRTDEIDEAVDNAIALARQFTSHLGDYDKLRYWTTDDAEVKAKAKEVIRNADFHETDTDREYRSHWLEDRNSFVRGWFFPFNDRGRGSFDTLWPSSVDYAAKTMGNEGTFEYAVSCIVLTDEEYIRKARKACVIRTETMAVGSGRSQQDC